MTRKLCFVSNNNRTGMESDSKSSDKSSLKSSTSSLSNCDSLQTSLLLNTSNCCTETRKSYSTNVSFNEILISESNQRKFKSKIVTSFDELQNLKAGSRLPVDISNFKGDLNVSSPKTNNSTNDTIVTKTTTKPNSKHTLMSSRDRLSDNEILRRLKNLSKTTQVAQKTKVVLPTQNIEPEINSNRKYFSFMTTNKQFNELAQRQTCEQKYKQSKQELDIALQKTSELSVRRLNNRYSSSSTSSTSSGSDSGCGSSIIARTSILSDSNEFQQPELENTSTSSLSSGPVQNLCDNNNTSLNENVKNLCGKIFAKNEVTKNSRRSSQSREHLDQSVGSLCSPKKSNKYVTILFDYETTCRSFSGVQSKFAVSKGQRVKVLRNYERDFLVATEVDSQIGFVPKDYTVDLKEVEERFKLNCQKSVQSHGQSFYNAQSYARPADDYESLKLTAL